MYKTYVKKIILLENDTFTNKKDTEHLKQKTI